MDLFLLLSFFFDLSVSVAGSFLRANNYTGVFLL